MLVRAALLALALPLLPSAAWKTRAPLPLARSEVAAAALGTQVAVVGGFLADGASSARVDLYRTKTDTWGRAADLPLPVNHSAAATLGGRLVVAGGYGATRSAWVLANGRWRSLPRLPAPRAAAGAAVLGGRLYVVGGVADGSLARNALEFDLRRSKWRLVAGPTPREHLAVVAAQGRLYALGGRTGGFDTNLATVESWRPGERRWRREPPIPEPRGGTGAATMGARIVSVGGEAQEGTIRSVYVFDTRSRTWSRVGDLPRPRHGLGVATVDATVYVIGGGTVPGLSVSDANDALCFARC
jgi:N-acetylneuraminic acid mutarotase